MNLNQMNKLELIKYFFKITNINPREALNYYVSEHFLDTDLLKWFDTSKSLIRLISGFEEGDIQIHYRFTKFGLIKN